MSGVVKKSEYWASWSLESHRVVHHISLQGISWKRGYNVRSEGILYDRNVHMLKVRFSIFFNIQT